MASVAKLGSYFEQSVVPEHPVPAYLPSLAIKHPTLPYFFKQKFATA